MVLYPRPDAQAFGAFQKTPLIDMGWCIVSYDKSGQGRFAFGKLGDQFLANCVSHGLTFKDKLSFHVDSSFLQEQGEKTSPYKKDCNSFLQEDCCSLIRIHLILFYYKEHHCDNALPEPNRYSIPFIEGRPWRRGLLEADSAANGQELKPALLKDLHRLPQGPAGEVGQANCLFPTGSKTRQGSFLSSILFRKGIHGLKISLIARLDALSHKDLLQRVAENRR